EELRLERKEQQAQNRISRVWPPQRDEQQADAERHQERELPLDEGANERQRRENSGRGEGRSDRRSFSLVRADDERDAVAGQGKAEDAPDASGPTDRQGGQGCQQQQRKG